MEAEFWTALAASCAAAAVTTSGIFVIRRFESWGRRNSTYFVSFAAGVLITVSFALMYVGATHLLLQAEKEHRRYSPLVFGAGIAMALGIIFSKG